MNTRAALIPLPRRLAIAAITALAVAGATHVATVLAFFISNDFAAELLGRINVYFLPSTVIALLALWAFGIIGWFSRWFLALAAGLVAGILGALVGTTITVALTGTPITADLLGAVVGTLGGRNLVFVLSAVVAAVTLGLLVWRALPVYRQRSAGIALVRLPASNLDEGELTHIKRKPIDAELADEQWDAYVDVLTEHGWTIVEVEAAPELADSVFVEDTVVVFGRTAVITSPGAESRRGETAQVERAVRSIGLRIERIALPGTLDGGDVLKVGSTVYVGRGGRTNAEGIRQLRAIVSRLGFTVVAVPITKVLHLKSAVTALPDGTVIGYAPNVDDASLFDRFLPVPEEGGSHVVQLSPDTVLMAASAPRSAALITELGYRVVTVDISEFEKLEGCVTCLSVRVR
jgi:dimethylargininase